MKKLEEKLQYLTTIRRAEVAEQISIARGFGDLSENAEYDEAKNEQAKVEARIAEINNILAGAVVVTASKRSSKVNIGSTVTLEMNGQERVFTIVGAAESNVKSGKISNESPFGAAIMGHKKGDEIVTAGPTGREIKIVIKKIEH